MAKIFYLMGPSGSGKDAIISGLRPHLHHDAGIMIAHRYITRHWQSGGENHIELSTTEFNLRKSLGLFSLSWEANGHQYGIGCEVDAWLNANHSVIVNGSREHLAEAQLHYADKLVPILIHVDVKHLKERLIQRNRESEALINDRIERSKYFSDHLPSDCHIIDNNQDINQAIHQLLVLIERTNETQLSE